MPSRRAPHALFATTLIAALALAACGDSAKLPPESSVGPSPQLPGPNKTLIPTVNIAPADSWPAGSKPQAASGLQVNALASGLDHPRWVYVLPNGDVLVAESNKPPKPEGTPTTIKGWIMGKVQARAGAGVPSANRISLLRDADGDGVAEVKQTFLDASSGLFSPFGMALVGNNLYVANADAVMRYAYNPGDTKISGAGTKVTDLPAGINHHWTKNLIASPDGSKLYVTVGSNSNIGENGMDIEEGRAAIWEIDRASGNKRLFASGLRNPNGMGWEPGSGVLWTVVNERDEIGSDLVPDYLTSVKDGAFYGWPWSYWGQTTDDRVQPARPEMVAKSIAPDYALGNHVAPLGLVFAGATPQAAPVPAPAAAPAASMPTAGSATMTTTTATTMPGTPATATVAVEASPTLAMAGTPTAAVLPPPTLPAAQAWPMPFASGAFVGQHGSWNRKPHSGYNVVFVPFANGKPSGPPVNVLTGFLSPDNKAWGRPVGVAIDTRGALLVADDVGNVIWRVAPAR